MIALAIFHAAFAIVLAAELVERPTKLKAVAYSLNVIYGAFYLSRVIPWPQ